MHGRQYLLLLTRDCRLSLHPMIHERVASVKMGLVPISPTRVWAPAFSRRSNFGARSQAAWPCTQERPPARKAVWEQHMRNRPIRPYFDTLVTFLWYDLV